MWLWTSVPHLIRQWSSMGVLGSAKNKTSLNGQQRLLTEDCMHRLIICHFVHIYESTCSCNVKNLPMNRLIRAPRKDSAQPAKSCNLTRAFTFRPKGTWSPGNPNREQYKLTIGTRSLGNIRLHCNMSLGLYCIDWLEPICCAVEGKKTDEALLSAN